MRRTRIIIAVTLLLLALVPLSEAGAHAPHDVIDDIAVSPDFAEDETLLVIVRGRLMRSGDGGQTWTVVMNGLDNGGILSQVEIAPTDASTVYAAADRTDGVYRSLDGGYSWERVSDGADTPAVSLLVASPHSAATVFAVLDGEGLVRSTDSGDSWDSIESESPVTALAFSPTDEARVLRGTASGVLEESIDEGETWRVLASTSDDALVAVAETDDGSVVVATADGRLLRLDADGDTFEQLSLDEPVVALVPSGSDLWALVGEIGPYLSPDGGDTWEKRTEGVTTDPQSDIPPNDVADFTDMTLSGDDTAFVGGWDGLFRSDDTGEQWRQVQTLDGMIVGLAISPDFANDDTLAVSTYVNGIHISHDGGQSWAVPGKDLEESGTLSRRLFNVVFSPAFAEDQTLFSSSTEAFLRSEDAAASWDIVDLGEVEPEAEATRLDIVRLSPTYESDETVYLGTREGNLLRSVDGGRTFDRVGELAGSVVDMALSPDFTEDRTMFASVRPQTDAGSGDPEAGVYKSTDGGETWEQTDFKGLGPLVISPQFADDATVFAGQRRAIHVSRDGGATWEQSSVPDWDRGPLEALSVSPNFAEDGLALASLRGRGLYRSTDGGDSFEQVVGDPIDENYFVADYNKATARPIQFSPAFAEDRTIFAFGGSDLLTTTDGGDTWEAVNRPASPAPDAGDIHAAVAGSSEDESSGSWLPIALAVAAVVALGAGAAWALSRRRPAAAGASPDESTND